MKLISDEFREWDCIHANTHDTAQKGLESEFELYKKQIIIEVAKADKTSILFVQPPDIHPVQVHHLGGGFGN